MLTCMKFVELRGLEPDHKPGVLPPVQEQRVVSATSRALRDQAIYSRVLRHATSLGSRRVRILLAALAAGASIAAALVYAGPAHADGILSASEARYVDLYAQPVLCVHLDARPTIKGVSEVIMGVAADGWDASSTADIVYYSIGLYCPRHMPLLNAAISQATSGGTGNLA